MSQIDYNPSFSSTTNGTRYAKVTPDGELNVLSGIDYQYNVALGRVPNVRLWNQYGFNDDIDVGTEVLASWGGTFVPLYTATTLSIVSSSTNDTLLGTGARRIIVSGIDENRDEQIEIVDLSGTTAIVTTSTWLGVNRVIIYEADGGLANDGLITLTAVSNSSVQSTIPVGLGISQAMIFHSYRNHQCLMDWMILNGERISGGDPTIVFIGWVYSDIAHAKFEAFRITMDTSTNSDIQYTPRSPFVLGESSVFWLEITTNKADTVASGRVSLTQILDGL